MHVTTFFNTAPSWMLCSVTAVIVIASIYSGFLLARSRNKLNEKDAEAPINTVVGATMALLAFILAFTFAATGARFDARRELVLNEVTAVETAFLRAGLVPEPHRSEVRALLKQYVDVRLEVMKDHTKVAQGIEQSQQLQKKMWSHAEALAQSDLKNPDIVTLFIESLNQVFETHTKRVTVALIARLPQVMWLTLYALTMLSMFGVGYLFGVSGKMNWPLIIALALAFSSVIMIIANLDRASGMIRVNTKPVADLQQRLNSTDQ